MESFFRWSRWTSTSKCDIEAGGGCWCCGGREKGKEKKIEKAADEEADEEKKAYAELIKDLDWAEESNRNWLNAAWEGTEVIVISGLAAAMACTLTLEPMKSQRLYGLRMWQYVVMATTLFAGLSIFRLLTKAVFGPILKSKWMLHRDLGYFLREMKTSVDVTLWLCTVLFAWYVWFRPQLRHVYGQVSVVLAHQLTRFLIAVCLGSLLWVAKDALFFWLEADLHYRQLCGHIKRTICQLHVLEILHNVGVWKFLNEPKNKKMIRELLDKIQKAESRTENNEPKSQDEEKIKVNNLEKDGRNICKDLLQVKRENVPVWILRRLCEEYLHQIQTRPLPVNKQTIQNPEELMKKALQLFDGIRRPHPAVTNSDQQPTSKTNTNNIPTEIDDDDDELKLADVKKRYNVSSEDLNLFYRTIYPCAKRENMDQNGQNGKKNGPGESQSSEQVRLEGDEIGRDEFCSWAVVAYRNCWGLRSTLESSELIILKLNRMMIVFVLILALIIWLLLSEIVDSAQIALLFSPLLAVKFIFSESTKNMFDGLIFALAMHPFNPGDRVIIHGMELLVMEINILSTTFYKYQSGEELVYPNSELATTHIINLETIPDQGDRIEFTISKNTPLEDIRDLEIKIQISLDYRRDAFKTKVVKTEMGLDDIKMTVQFNYVGAYLTSEMKAVHRSEMLSTIMHLEKKMQASNPVQAVSSACKPYIVNVILNKKVKLEYAQIIKDAVVKAIQRYQLGECSEMNICNFKVVLNNVTGKHVRMAFYVWTTSSRNPDEQQKHATILKQDLDRIQDWIFDNLSEVPSSSGDNAGSNQSLVFANVQIQTKPGVAEIEYDPSNKDSMEDVIKRYFCKNCYQYEVEVKIMDNLLYVYAWRQFPHGIEEEKHPIDVQQQIFEANLGEINKLDELTKTRTKISKIIPGVAEIERPMRDKQIMENVIKRYFCKYYHQDVFEVKIIYNRLYIYAWRQFPHKDQPSMQQISDDNLEENKDQPDMQQILDEHLEEINKLEELTRVSTKIIKKKPGVALIEKPMSTSGKQIMENVIKRYFCKKNHQDEYEVKIMDKRLHIYGWRQDHQLDMQKILDDSLEEINQLDELKSAWTKLIKD